MKLNWIKSTLTVAAALALATNLSAQRHGPAAAADKIVAVAVRSLRRSV